MYKTLNDLIQEELSFDPKRQAILDAIEMYKRNASSIPIAEIQKICPHKGLIITKVEDTPGHPQSGYTNLYNCPDCLKAWSEVIK